jgi:hypothetical protein
MTAITPPTSTVGRPRSRAYSSIAAWDLGRFPARGRGGPVDDGARGGANPHPDVADTGARIVEVNVDVLEALGQVGEHLAAAMGLEKAR